MILVTHKLRRNHGGHRPRDSHAPGAASTKRRPATRRRAPWPSRWWVARCSCGSRRGRRRPGGGAPRGEGPRGAGPHRGGPGEGRDLRAKGGRDRRDCGRLRATGSPSCWRRSLESGRVSGGSILIRGRDVAFAGAAIGLDRGTSAWPMCPEDRLRMGVVGELRGGGQHDPRLPEKAGVQPGGLPEAGGDPGGLRRQDGRL